MRGVEGVIRLGEGGDRASTADELDVAVRRRISGTLHASLAFASLDHTVSKVVVKGPVSLKRLRLSISSTLMETPRSPYKAEAALPATVIVRGLPSTLRLRRLEAAREKCSGHALPSARAASVTDWHAAQHGRKGTVTTSERDGEGEGFRGVRACRLSEEVLGQEEPEG